MTAREAAFVSLQKYENNKKFANIEADTAIRRNGLEGADKALYTSIFYGTVERKITLDYIIDCLCDRKQGIDANVRIILRLSLYQMRYLDRVPDYAIVNDAAELCKRFAAKSAVSFVNAVLHAYRREEKRLKLPDAKKEPYRCLSVAYAYPEWLCKMWSDMYGYEKAEAIFRAFDENPPITLRVNTCKTDAEALGEKLRAKTVGYRPTAYVPGGIRLTGHCPIDEIPGFSEGECFVQDEASQIAAYVLGAQPGEFVIDACSCPGGKSFSTALRMNNEGRILSCDLHKNKLKLVSEGAQKLGITIIETREQNGSVFVPEFEGKADRVLCDVPCSGLGVLSKKPDIRHKTQDEITRLPEIQYAILENCARYVKDGGVLVYSTCTLNRAENEETVGRFLKNHPDFAVTPFVVGNRTVSGMITLFPDEYPGCDGFFVAKMVKLSSEKTVLFKKETIITVTYE